MIGFVLWEVLVTIIVLNDFQWQSILTPWGYSSHETVPWPQKEPWAMSSPQKILETLCIGHHVMPSFKEL